MTDTATETATFNLGTVGMLCTRKGLNVLSAGLTGERIVFTKLAIGDGILDVTSDSEYRVAVLNKTEMTNWRMDLPICENVNKGDGTMLLHAIKTNAEIVEGFFAREQAVFAIDQATGEEILYAYRNSGDNSSFLPANTGPVAKTIDLGVVTVIQNAQNVEAILSQDFAYVSMADYKLHVDAEHAHPNMPNYYGNVYDTNAFWSANQDNHLYQMSVDNTRHVILGDAAELIPSLGKTITDNQAKINELKIIADAQNELGLEANMMIVEDFKPATEIDVFKMKVLSCAQNGKIIGVQSDEGIIAGQYYWISDGNNQELVQVIGAVYSTDYYHVELAERLTYGYNLSTVYLYRSTVLDNTATVDKKWLSWTPKYTFKGISANIERVNYLDTSQYNRAALNISGEGVVTRDGYFTLTNDEGSFEYTPDEDAGQAWVTQPDIDTLFAAIERDANANNLTPEEVAALVDLQEGGEG